MQKLDIKINEQQKDECLSECLFSVMQYYDVNVKLNDIISCISKDSDKLYDWEFKAGEFAQKNGLKSTIYTNINYLFDPSWCNLKKNKLLKKLKLEAEYFSEKEKLISKEPDQKNYIYPNKLIARRYKKEVNAVISYLENDGKIIFNPISKKQIKSYINDDIPVIVSHNPTLLHNMKRAYYSKPDDIRGMTWGHVVIISGYDREKFLVADPGGDFYKNSYEYLIDADRLVESVLRYNGQMMVITKKSS